MKFPLGLSLRLARYVHRQGRQGRKRFPVVMMLEPTHRCNLRCEGCGRIREFGGGASGGDMTVAECLSSVEECEAPIVTVTGGEPLLHPEIGEIVRGIQERGRTVYLCTNALKLVDSLDKFEPSGEFQLNVHLDGLAATHERVTRRPGAFEAVTAAIREAKSRGFRVCTNSTLYKFTPDEEVLGMLEHLKGLGVDGILLSPAFDFESNGGGDVYMSREEIQAKMGRLAGHLRRYRVINTPIFVEYLLGERDLACSPWAIPTRNARGWKGPCYMITDGHWPSWQGLMEGTDWARFEQKRDPRCRNCMTHCGFEPTVMIESRRRLRDGLKMLRWQLF
jgi:hopanoid biosynthesis associated radical SAM protein HpnH